MGFKQGSSQWNTVGRFPFCQSVSASGDLGHVTRHLGHVTRHMGHHTSILRLIDPSYWRKQYEICTISFSTISSILCIDTFFETPTLKQYSHRNCFIYDLQTGHYRNTKIQIRYVKNTDFWVKIQTTFYMPYRKGHGPELCNENTTKSTGGSYAKGYFILKWREDERHFFVWGESQKCHFCMEGGFSKLQIFVWGSQKCNFFVCGILKNAFFLYGDLKNAIL